MDRLTTGRRHRRAGSVTVTELLTKQGSPARCTDSSPTEPDEITETIPVVGRSSHRRPATKGTQFAKIASIGVASAVLCGAVTVSSVIAHQRREAAQPAARPATQITGERALLPDRLDETAPSTEAPAAPAPPPAAAERPVPSTTTPAPAPTSNDQGGTAASAGTTQAPPTPATDLDLVRAFYENLPDAPDAAFELLSPDLLDTSLGEFLASWSKVTRIELVDVVQRVDGVLATVRLQLLDGSHLRLQQLLTVAESPRRIVGVQLLSAQRN